MAKNDDNKIDVANAADSDPTGLRMDPDRTRRFRRALSRMNRAIHSLEAATPHFEGLDIHTGRMDPGATLRAFSDTMSEDIELMYQMLANEEAAEPDATEGGA
jgi:hypothetical protein